MQRPNGSLQLSSDLLARAVELRPNDPSIKHSFAELHVRLADQARTGLERSKHLDAATALCRQLTGRFAEDAYGYVTLAKVGLKKLEEALDSGNALAIEQSVKEVESALGDGLQRFPNDAYLRESEARLANAINDSDRAVTALQKALQTNPRSTFIAIRLAQSYRKRNDEESALKVLVTALEANNGDRRLHYAYAKLLLATNASNEKLFYHLQRAFNPGDANYDAQLLYARQLYLGGRMDEAWKVFKVLKVAPVSPEVKFQVLYPADGFFTGEVTRMEATYCFIARDGIGDHIYAHRDNIGDAWADLASRRRVVFRFGFSFGGPSAFEITSEQIKAAKSR
jgi:tetratricopeptide (TPR) repeat protein